MTWIGHVYVHPREIIRDRLLPGADGDLANMTRLGPEAFTVWGALEWEARTKLTLQPDDYARILDGLRFSAALRAYVDDDPTRLDPDAPRSIGFRRRRFIALEPHQLHRFLPAPDSVNEADHNRQTITLLRTLGWLHLDAHGKSARAVRTSSGVRRMLEIPAGIIDTPNRRNQSLLYWAIANIADHPAATDGRVYPQYDRRRTSVPSLEAETDLTFPPRPPAVTWATVEDDDA